MNQPWIYTCSPSRSPLPPSSPSHPSGSSQCTRPKHLSHSSNLGWRSVSPLIIHMFQCYSLRSSHPRFLPQSPKVCSVHLCLFFCFATSGEFLIARPSFFSRKSTNRCKSSEAASDQSLKFCVKGHMKVTKFRSLRRLPSRESWSISEKNVEGKQQKWKIFSPGFKWLSLDMAAFQCRGPLVNPGTLWDLKSDFSWLRDNSFQSSETSGTLTVTQMGANLSELLLCRGKVSKMSGFFHCPPPHSFHCVGCLCSDWNHKVFSGGNPKKQQLFPEGERIVKLVSWFLPYIRISRRSVLPPHPTL